MSLGIDEHRRPFDDDVSTSSSVSDDAPTLPCDIIADDDLRSVASHDSFDSCGYVDDLPLYRVPKEQGVSQPVYEAWILCPSESCERVESTRFCGLNVFTRYSHDEPTVACSTKPYGQDELSEMTLDAVQRYQAASKRSFPSRLFRGRAKSYEVHLDERILKLPYIVQSELNGLLADREEATRNRFHRRDWTVAMMREQYHYRFASAESKEVKGPRRFWKKGARGPIEYLFILRGAEGQVATDDKGIYQATMHSNPWKRVDATEKMLKQRARDIRRFGKGFVQDEWHCRRRDRSPSPPPPRRVRIERNDTEAFPPVNPFVPGPRSGGFAMDPPRCLFPSGLTPPPGVSRPPSPLVGPPPYCRPSGRLGTYYPPSPPPPPPPPPPMPEQPPRPEFMYRDSDGVFAGMYDHPRCIPPSGGMIYPVIVPEALAPHQALGIVDLSGGHLRWRAPVPPVVPQDTGSSYPSPPAAPRLSNLTTPTTFSPATSNRTGSSADQTEVSTPVDVGGHEVREAGSRPGSAFGLWSGTADARE